MFKLLLLLLLAPATLLAQNTVTGKVVALTDKRPIANVSVFLNNSSVGNETQQDGTFMLTHVKNGQYDLVVSCVGYETYHQHLSIYNSSVALPDIELEPSINTLTEVKIVSKQKRKSIKEDPNRKRYIRMFTEAFFGNTHNARECKLINPDLLDFVFDESADKLSATSHGFLILENKALGYRIKYLLTSFLIDPGAHIIGYAGSYVFTPMESTAKQQLIWQEKREIAYLGSEMHFLRDCISDELDNDGFTVREMIRTPIEGRPSDSLIYANIKRINASPATPSDKDYWVKQANSLRYDQKLIDKPLPRYKFISKTDIKGIYAISYPNCLVINYKNGNSTSTLKNTIITFTEPYAFFDSNGVIANPQSNKVEYYWSTLRVADLLPVDYELPKK